MHLHPFSRFCLLTLSLTVFSACTVGAEPCEPEVIAPTVGPANGGFHGIAVCTNVERKIDFSLIQDFDDTDVDGRVFIETNVRYIDGLFDIMIPYIIAGDLLDGELQGNTLTGLILTETVDPRASAQDFSLSLEMERDSAGNVVSLSGTVSQLDANNEPVLDCDVTAVSVREPRP